MPKSCGSVAVDMWKGRTYAQAIVLQREMLSEATDVNASPNAKAACVNAFIGLEYLKRVMRMKPNPKPIDVIPTGAARPLIDYKRLVRRPAQKALIDVSEPKPPGPRTVISSSGYYKAQADQSAPVVAQDPKPSENAPTGSVVSASNKPQEQDPNKTQ
jgi:hypothetical protein